MNTPRIPPPDDHLKDAAQQFVSASVALVSAVEKLGMRVEDLDTFQSGTAEDLTSLHARISEAEGHIKAIEQKPEDRSKWVDRGVSLVALIVAVVSAVYSIKYGGISIETSR